MIGKRALSTLIPPKLVSAKQLGSSADAKRISNVVGFYKALPQGPAPAVKNGWGPIGRYKARYYDGDNASGKPIWHLACAVLALGYSMEYYFHLRHHKGEH